MRTRLKAAFVVGFTGTSHELWRDGEVVFSGDTIEFVGREFPGPVDHTVDYGLALISPGLIDLDALGDLGSGVLTVDNGDKRDMGRLWSQDQADSQSPWLSANRFNGRPRRAPVHMAFPATPCRPPPHPPRQ